MVEASKKQIEFVFKNETEVAESARVTFENAYRELINTNDSLYNVFSSLQESVEDNLAKSLENLHLDEEGKSSSTS